MPLSYGRASFHFVAFVACTALATTFSSYSQTPVPWPTPKETPAQSPCEVYHPFARPCVTSIQTTQPPCTPDGGDVYCISDQEGFHDWMVGSRYEVITSLHTSCLFYGNHPSRCRPVDGDPCVCVTWDRICVLMYMRILVDFRGVNYKCSGSTPAVLPCNFDRGWYCYSWNGSSEIIFGWQTVPNSTCTSSCPNIYEG